MKVFILILFVNICFSQDIEKLKKIDTVYIFFNYSNYEKITEFKAQNKNKTTYLYQFFSSNGDYINFSYSSFKDFEHLRKGIKTDIKTVSKKFLRKNKDKILDINFFNEIGFRETYYALFGKVVYIIDSKEIKGRKVKLKQLTRVDAPNYTEE